MKQNNLKYYSLVYLDIYYQGYILKASLIAYTIKHMSDIASQTKKKKEIINAFLDPSAIMIYISGHGEPDGGIDIFNDTGELYPSDLKNKDISKDLQTVILANCFQGNTDNRQDWQETLKSVELITWERKTNNVETMSFNSIGLFDRQDNNFRHYCNKTINYYYREKPKPITYFAGILLKN